MVFTERMCLISAEDLAALHRGIPRRERRFGSVTAPHA